MPNETEPGPELQAELRGQYSEYLSKLFQTALNKCSLDFVCTVLRVSGMSDANWDPMEESLEAFEDLSTLLRTASDEKHPKKAYRIALLMYCHAIEMSSVHDILQNLLRCVRGEHFHINPFLDMMQKKKKPFSLIPPSAKTKFRRIKNTARESSESRLAEIIDLFFDDQVRNAFSHSDYCITDKHFRSLGGYGQAISLEVLSKKITHCFAFYEAFFQVLRDARRQLSKANRFQKLANYAVLELLSKDGVLTGFKFHFSNGSCARYERSRERVVAENFSFAKSGGIELMVGDSGAFEATWKVNGVPVTDWEALNRR